MQLYQSEKKILLSKIAYFVTTTKGILAEGLARLFRNNVWKLDGLPENVILDRKPQFVVELTKELNSMLGIQTRFSTAFYQQTDRQTEYMNQELEQYLQFFVDHRQKDWHKQLVFAKFVVNNKIHLVTKVSPFMEKYGRELRMRVDIRRKRKVEKTTEFVEKMKRIQEKVGAALRRAQEEMKRQTDRGRNEAETWKKNRIV